MNANHEDDTFGDYIDRIYDISKELIITDGVMVLEFALARALAHTEIPVAVLDEALKTITRALRREALYHRAMCEDVQDKDLQVEALEWVVNGGKEQSNRKRHKKRTALK